ncbi:glycosyltransferase family 2 protein [Candidatus Woesearchaeota archaeon]|nr:glycosyltransferase family 2 protein [Candidatus Woesearchaeota archaeon]
MTNVLIVPERNEKLKPLNVVERGLKSGNVDEIYIVDGWSTDGTAPLLKRKIPRLQKKYNKKIKIFYSELRDTGKGGAIVTGMKRALKDNHSKILFLGSDITSTTPEWCDVLAEGIDKNRVDMCRGYFDMAPFDAQIERHTVRPLINMFFPEGKGINQPLGGELCMTKELAEYILKNIIAPPHTWGIDVFLTVITLKGKFKVAEQYLAQKGCNKKSSVWMRPISIECFDEMSKLIYYKRRYLKIPKFKKSFVKQLPHSPKIKRIGPDIRKVAYNNPDYEIEMLLGYVKNLIANGQITPTRINNVSLSKFEDSTLILDLLRAKSTEEFKEKSRFLTRKEWIRIINTLVRKFIHFNFAKMYYELYYLLWELRSLSFCLNEARTFNEAEENTRKQDELAFAFGQSKDIVL